MPYAFSNAEISDFEALLSPPRFATYLRETNGDRHRALELCIWNTQVSEAFYSILQFCELAVRNAAVEAIESEFGANWHLNRGFVYTLSTAKGRYSPRTDLVNCSQNQPTAGKVVAELKFAFWQYIFVKSHDQRLWLPHLAAIFPGCDNALSVAQARAKIHSDLDAIRKFRNRVAHHEPIFNRNLIEDKERILTLVSWRRPALEPWINQFEQVSQLLQARP
jgi:hypothetical protein